MPSFPARSLLVLGSWLAALSLVGAQDVPDVLDVRDGSHVRRFDVSRTEAQRVRFSDGTQEVVRFAARRNGTDTATHLRTLERAAGQRHDLVLYETGKPQSSATRRVVTRRLVARLLPAADLNTLKQFVNATSAITPPHAPGFAVFEFASGQAALAALPALRAAAGVESAEVDLARQFEKRFVPNDPRYAHSATNTAYQWHLKNTGQNDGTAGEDVIGIETLWDAFRGNGLTISIVDDGLQINHPDLAANSTHAFHRDWNDNTPNDPTGRLAQDNHGTNCAGVAAAVGNNGIGVVGAAMNARLVGLRLIAGDVGDVETAEALGWRTDIIHVSNNSWGPPDDGKDLRGPGPLSLAALENGTANGRGGKGIIYAWAAGNGHDKTDRSNYDGYNNSPYTLSVGGIDDQGGMTFYSEHGANLIVSAHSNGNFRQGITTTSNAGYTDDFGGTSSATPLVSGVIALMLQANPNLGWRDVQEILIRTARKNAPADTEWVVNGAGFNFNHKFGAGAVNAQAAVAMAQGWTNLGTRRTHSVTQAGVNASIPDNNAAGVTQVFDLAGADQMRLEHVLLSLRVTHPRRGDLDIRVTAPSGTSSTVFLPHALDTNANIALSFPFLSVRHWGENLQGSWTVTVSDRAAASTGTLDDVKLEFFGTRATPLATTPVITSPAAVSGAQGRPFAYQIAANNNPASYAATDLPRGLTVNTTTGLISGTTAASGAVAITVSATNAAGTGTQNVTLNLAETPGTTFAEFREARFTPQQLDDDDYSSEDDDPDFDGLNNLLEFAFGSIPTDDDNLALPHFVTDAGSTFFEYRTDEDAVGITITPQASDTLAAWADLVPSLHTQAAGIKTWRVALPSGGVSRRFYRISVTSP
ncbi:MAG TPA: S8 family serine peptidase [Prosthecobacter sp.]